MFKRNTKRKTGKFSSQKMGRLIKWESYLERDLIYLLEFETEVLKYIEQPFKITVKINGKVHWYRPDFLVQKKECIEIIEVKPTWYLNEPESLQQRAIGEAFCSDKDIIFKVVTEKEIQEGNFLKNVKILFRYSRTKVSLKHSHKIFQVIKDTNPLTIEELSQRITVSGKEEMECVIYNLIFKKHLFVDLTQPLSKKTLILGGIWQDG